MSMLYTRIVRLVSNVNIKKADGRIEGRGLRPRDNIRLRRTAPLRLRLGFRSIQSDCSFDISVLYL